MSSKNKLKKHLIACFLCLYSTSYAFAVPRSTPSKIRVPDASPSAVEAPVQKNTIPAPARKASPSKIPVTQEQTTLAAQQEAPNTATKPVENQQEPKITAVQNRRSTPSKIPATPDMTEAEQTVSIAQEKASQQVQMQDSELAVALAPSVSNAQNTPNGHIPVSKKIKPYKEGAEIYVVDTPVPTGNEFNVVLVSTKLDEDIVIADADEDTTENRHGTTLSTILSTPSKIPAPAIKKNNKDADTKSIDIQASAALVVDQDTGEIVYSKSAQDIMPIASISKLMTAMVVLDAKQSLNEKITITADDIDTTKNTSSRLNVGTQLTRKELLHLSLMSSENRAAHALARNYPGGKKAFVKAMNAKAKKLGLTQTSYVEPTGLSPKNRSSARDLVWLVKAAHNYSLIRQYSTASSKKIVVGKNKLSYKNSNQLIGNTGWNIGIQKTGYIREAGYCMVAQTSIANKRYIMVFLNADARVNRIDDAEKIRAMIKEQPSQYASASTRKKQMH